jgi:hypothetical protein
MEPDINNSLDSALSMRPRIQLPAPVLDPEQIRQSSLENWYKDYLDRKPWAADLLDVGDDKLDEEFVERQIRECMPTIQIQDGYCTVCQEFLKTWFKACDPSNQLSTKSFDLTWNMNLTQFVASSRRSCQFCKLWLQAMTFSGWLKFRKIEERLHTLRKPHFLSITTYPCLDEMIHNLYLNYPGTKGPPHLDFPRINVIDAIRMEASGLGSTPLHKLN